MLLAQSDAFHVSWKEQKESIILGHRGQCMLHGIDSIEEGVELQLKLPPTSSQLK